MVRSGGIEVLLTRALDPGRAGRGGHGAASATLSATWSGQSEPVELAGITIT
jgi:hypothetical protein